MTKLLQFARLDFMTIKPYFLGKNLFIYLAMAIFLSIINGGAASGLGVGAIIAMLMSGHTFAVGEKCNADALYVTLSFKRKQVVAGRYMFFLIFNVVIIVCAVIVGAFAGIVSGALGMEVNSVAIEVWIALAAVFVLAQAIQLPLYFKLGYTKARFIILFPIVLLYSLFFVALMLLRDAQIMATVTGIFTPILNSPILLWGSVAVVFVLLVFVSYRAAQGFYGKREF